MSVLESIGCVIGSLVILICIYLFISSKCEKKVEEKESEPVQKKERARDPKTGRFISNK